jgi:hypothetical protein
VGQVPVALPPSSLPVLPPEFMDKQYLALAAKEIGVKFPDNHGFILLVLPFGESGRTNYISNCQREDAIKVLKEFLFRIGAEEDWMKHIK